MTKNYLMIDLNDPRAARIAEVFSNKTCKRILEILADEELSESDISTRLKIPMNTTGYNIKKLIESGLIEKTRKFLWSSKGKRIAYYKISNKKIVISPKARAAGIIPTVIATGLIALGLRFINSISTAKNSIADSSNSLMADSFAKAAETTVTYEPSMAEKVYFFIANAPNSSVWFLIGGLTALLIFLLINWRKK